MMIAPMCDHEFIGEGQACQAKPNGYNPCGYPPELHYPIHARIKELEAEVERLRNVHERNERLRAALSEGADAFAKDDHERLRMILCDRNAENVAHSIVKERDALRSLVERAVPWISEHSFVCFCDESAAKICQGCAERAWLTEAKEILK